MKIGGLSLTMYIFQFIFILIGLVIAGVLRKFLPGILADVVGLISFLVLDYFSAGIIYTVYEKPIHKIIDKKLKKDK
ncbi:MAG: hypothetical protein IPL21_03365 [Saprospirales bacterium]|nr:hypothetical protein [Saprospirales bacterium]